MYLFSVNLCVVIIILNVHIFLLRETFLIFKKHLINVQLQYLRSNNWAAVDFGCVISVSLTMLRADSLLLIDRSMKCYIDDDDDNVLDVNRSLRVGLEIVRKLCKF